MITGSYAFTVEELITAQRHAAKEIARRWVWILVSPIGVCMVTSAIWFSSSMVIWLRIYIGIVGLLLVLHRPLMRSFTKAHFRKRPDQNIVVRFEIGDSGVSWSSSDSTSTMTWRLVSKVRRHGDGFLVFTNPKVFHWIPNHALGTAGQVDELARIFAANVTDYQTKA